MATYADLRRYGTDLERRSVKDPSRMSYLKRLREAYGKPLLDLSADEINGWIAGLGVAPSTHRLVMNYVKNALKFLNGGEPPAVSRRITRPKGKALPRIRVPRELLTPGEVEEMIHTSRRLDLKALIALHVATGARPSELLNLNREDVEFVTKKGVPAVRIWIVKTKTDSPPPEYHHTRSPGSPVAQGVDGNRERDGPALDLSQAASLLEVPQGFGRQGRD